MPSHLDPSLLGVILLTVGGAIFGLRKLAAGTKTKTVPEALLAAVPDPAGPKKAHNVIAPPKPVVRHPFVPNINLGMEIVLHGKWLYLDVRGDKIGILDCGEGRLPSPRSVRRAVARRIWGDPSFGYYYQRPTYQGATA